MIHLEVEDEPKYPRNYTVTLLKSDIAPNIIVEVLLDGVLAVRLQLDKKIVSLGEDWKNVGLAL